MIACTLGIQKKNTTNFAKRTELTGLFGVNTERNKHMKKLIQKIKDSITFPFVAMAILLDESRSINEHGDWNDYHAKRNAKGGAKI